MQIGSLSDLTFTKCVRYHWRWMNDGAFSKTDYNTTLIINIELKNDTNILDFVKAMSNGFII